MLDCKQNRHYLCIQCAHIVKMLWFRRLNHDSAPYHIIPVGLFLFLFYRLLRAGEQKTNAISRPKLWPHPIPQPQLWGFKESAQSWGWSARLPDIPGNHAMRKNPSFNDERHPPANIMTPSPPPGHPFQRDRKGELPGKNCTSLWAAISPGRSSKEVLR